MRKESFIKLTVICTLVVIICAGAIFAVQGSDRFTQGSDLGQAIKGQVDANISSELTGHTPEIAGTVLGEDIPVERVEIIAAMYQYGGFDEPLTRAWNDVKVQVYEKQFAAEKDCCQLSRKYWISHET